MIKKFTSIDEVNNITSENIFKPQIALIGVGGAGTNAVNNMISMGLTGVKFVVVNTDSKSLENSLCPYKLQIGPKVTKGLGAGSKPEIGGQAAEESIAEIKEILKGVNLLFITAGMGGGTGTGASQVIAKLAKEMDILTISFVTKPFAFEGNQRMDIADAGILELEKYSDALVVISNQNLFSVVDDKTSLSDAFRATDSVLFSGIKAITDLLVSSGLVNLDFNDIKYVIEGKGRAMIGYATASGASRAIEVAKQAILNPLLEDVSIFGAKSILINITGSLDMTLHEVDVIINTIKHELDKDAFINFGAIHDAELVDTLKVAVVATALQDRSKVLLLRKNAAEKHSFESSSYGKILQEKKAEFSKKQSSDKLLYKHNASHAEQDSVFLKTETDNSAFKVKNEENLEPSYHKYSDEPSYENIDNEEFSKNNDDSHGHHEFNNQYSSLDDGDLHKKDTQFKNSYEYTKQDFGHHFKDDDYKNKARKANRVIEAEDNNGQKDDYLYVAKNDNKTTAKNKKVTESSFNDSSEEDNFMFSKINEDSHNHYVNEDNNKEEPAEKPKSGITNLFDLIVKNKTVKEEEVSHKIKEDDIMSIKNRNKISKDSHTLDTKEDSFFDLPAFLKKK